MELSWRSMQQALVWSLVIIIIPMVAFPARFGTDLTMMSMANFLFEMVFYGVVLYFFNRRSNLFQLIKGAGICFIYRTIVGACVGLLVSLLYSMDLTISLTLGVSGYLPAILLQAAAAPFIMRPLLKLSVRRRRPVKPVEPRMPTENDSGVTTIAISKSQPIGQQEDQRFGPDKVVDEFERHTSLQSGTVNNGFERAVRYIAEHGSVYLAAVVDYEGLLMAGFTRGSDAIAEDWAPFALLFHQNNKALTSRVAWNEPEQIDILMSDQRLIVAKTHNIYLMVVAERNSDDVLNIRFNQALDMIGKYVAERYSEKLFVKAEKQYV